MLETLLGISIITTPADLGLLAAVTTAITQLLKQIVPKSFPTGILATIIALIVTLTATIIMLGVAFDTIAVGILSGLMVAFVSTNGFDSLREIWKRYHLELPMEENDDDSEEGGNG